MGVVLSDPNRVIYGSRRQGWGLGAGTAGNLTAGQWAGDIFVDLHWRSVVRNNERHPHAPKRPQMPFIVPITC